MILAGDVGGTKIHLALHDGSAPPGEKAGEAMLVTGAVASLPEAVAALAARAPRPVRACALGVAGPLLDGDVVGTNLPWPVRRAEISRALGGAPVTLLNDLEAAGHGLDALRDDELALVHEGDPAPGANRGLVSPGTGLGESILLRRGEETLPVGSEGGHADFAPRTDEEIDLLRHLRARWGRVSVERVVSGPGLVNVFCWLRDSGRVPDDSGIDARPGDSAPAARISTAALADGGARICREALRVWVAALASEAGNLALRGTTVGGVFLGGGIPPRILPALRGDNFASAFRTKEPHAAMLERVPVRVVMATDTALRGAARVAAALL